MVQDSPSRHLAQFQLRLPDGMRDQLKEAAQKGNRTLNAEIVSRLEFSFAVDIMVHEDGFDVGHGHTTPEFKAAYLKSRENRQGGNSPSPRAFTDDDLDYLAEALAKRMQQSKGVELPEAGSKLLLERMKQK